MANSKLMLDDRLDADEFLTRIVYQQNTDDFGMLDVALVSVLIDEDDEVNCAYEIESVPSPTSSTQSTASSQSVGQCALCEAEPELLMLPCFDFCMCQSCWEILKSTYDTPNCPSCGVSVKKARQIKFYQQ